MRITEPSCGDNSQKAAPQNDEQQAGEWYIYEYLGRVIRMKFWGYLAN
jgi:hypothetical protein